MNFLETYNYEIPLKDYTRTDYVNKTYAEFKKNLNIPINDYIIENYLKDINYNICPNKFPYNTPQNMAHYILWINPKYENKITDKKVCEIIYNKMNELGYNEYFCFENHVNAKSVKGVLHYQIFFSKC